MTGQPNIDPKTGSLSGLRTTQPEHIICADSIAGWNVFLCQGDRNWLWNTTPETGRTWPLPALRPEDLSRLGLRVRLRHCGCCLLRGMDAAPRGKTSDFRSDHRQVGKDAHAADRQGVSVAFRVLETGPPSWFKTLPLGQLDQALLSQQRWIETR